MRHDESGSRTTAPRASAMARATRPHHRLCRASRRSVSDIHEPYRERHDRALRNGRRRSARLTVRHARARAGLWTWTRRGHRRAHRRRSHRRRRSDVSARDELGRSRRDHQLSPAGSSGEAARERITSRRRCLRTAASTTPLQASPYRPLSFRKNGNLRSGRWSGRRLQ